MRTLDCNTPLMLQLPERHRRALSWFVDRMGQTVSLPNQLEPGTLLFTQAKGIYKPAWSEYALSVKETASAGYDDREPIVRKDGTWVYLYHQEGAPTDGKRYFTNDALKKCLNDGVPVGVVRQESPGAGYMVLGLALVTGYGGGYFVLEALASPARTVPKPA
jgi:putative restriction endonuclease